MKAVEDEEEEEEEEDEIVEREQQVLGLEAGLGMWLVAARRTALSGSGKPNDDEIELRAAGGGAIRDDADGAGGAEAADIQPSNWSGGGGARGGEGAGEWRGGVGIGKNATDKTAPEEDSSGAGGKGKAGRNRGGKRSKHNKGKNVAGGDGKSGGGAVGGDKSKSEVMKFDSQGRPIIKVSAGAVPSLGALLDQDAGLLEQKQTACGEARTKKGKGKKPKGGKNQQQDGLETKSPSNEELVVRVVSLALTWSLPNHHFSRELSSFSIEESSFMSIF